MYEFTIAGKEEMSISTSMNDLEALEIQHAPAIARIKGYCFFIRIKNSDKINEIAPTDRSIGTNILYALCVSVRTFKLNLSGKFTFVNDCFFELI